MIKLKDFPLFKRWCEEVTKGNEKIDLQTLSNKQRDSGLAAYCLDVNNPEFVYLANMINSEFTPYEWKNNFYQNMEPSLFDLCEEYNLEQDLKSAEASYAYINNIDSYISSDSERIRSFSVNQDMYDAGHKPSDFC